VQELEAIIGSPDALQHYGVPVSLLALANQDAELAAELLHSPAASLPLMDQALVVAQEDVMARLATCDDEACVKVRAHVACHAQPRCRLRSHLRRGARAKSCLCKEH